MSVVEYIATIMTEEKRKKQQEDEDEDFIMDPISLVAFRINIRISFKSHS